MVRDRQSIRGMTTIVYSGAMIGVKDEQSRERALFRGGQRRGAGRAQWSQRGPEDLLRHRQRTWQRRGCKSQGLTTESLPAAPLPWPAGCIPIFNSPWTTSSQPPARPFEPYLHLCHGNRLTPRSDQPTRACRGPRNRRVHSRRLRRRP